MGEDTDGQDSFRKVTAEARALGEELARLLERVPLSSEEKDAWAALVPFMTLEELGRFQRLLLSHLERQVFDEAEDIILAMKAEELKRQFAVAHAQHDAEKALDALEAEVDTLEGAAQ
jgi:hypothetical protein